MNTEGDPCRTPLNSHPFSLTDWKQLLTVQFVTLSAICGVCFYSTWACLHPNDDDALRNVFFIEKKSFFHQVVDRISADTFGFQCCFVPLGISHSIAAWVLLTSLRISLSIWIGWGVWTDQCSTGTSSEFFCSWHDGRTERRPVPGCFRAERL